jgi:hypothetical protein
MRIIGLDIHRAFAEAVAWDDGKLKRLGRVDMRRPLLDAMSGLRRLQPAGERKFRPFADACAEWAEPSQTGHTSSAIRRWARDRGRRSTTFRQRHHAAVKAVFQR